MHRCFSCLFRVFLPTAIALAIALNVPCAGAQGDGQPDGGEAVPDEVLSPGESAKDSLEQHHEEWSQKILSTATYMDSFFDNERYSSTSNKTYLRFRASPIVDRNGLSLNTYVDLRLLLPNTERWLVNFGGDPDEEDRYGSSPLEDQERDDSGRNERNAYLGVSSFLKRTRTRNVGFGGGVRFRNVGIVPYGTFKWIELWEFKNWDLRAMQRVRYYTDDGLEFKSQLDAEWPIAHKFFARGTGSILIKHHDPNKYMDLDYALYQYLTTRRAIKYQIRTGYTSATGRSTYLASVNYEIQYRQQWRDWFYTNITPQISQYDSRDWKVDPGFRVDFNFRFGHEDAYAFKSAYEKKQENLELKAREDRDKALEEGHQRFMQWKKEQEDEPRKGSRDR